MRIDAQSNISDLYDYAYEKFDKLEISLVEAFKVACIEMVIRAKQTKTYTDQTHKLRSSIGCVLYYRGEEIYNYFESTGGEKGEEGIRQGLIFARKKAEEKANKTIVAVVVAGAEYARYVEKNGFDVLTGSSHRFADDLRKEVEAVMSAFFRQLKNDFGIL